MRPFLVELRGYVGAALTATLGPDAAGADPEISRSKDGKHGDYQCNAAMGLAKRLGLKPPELAQRIIDALPPAALAMVEKPGIAGPGFINFRIKQACLEAAIDVITSTTDDARLCIEPVAKDDALTVVVDYSSPNVAKEMHVGHLRSTIIGDTIARVMDFQGHRVIRQNHLGDWGTQFGKIILALWHLCMARRQGETVADFNRLADELSRLAKSPLEAKRALLQARRDIHQENLSSDPTGDEFHKYIENLEPSFEILLPAYRYVNALEEAAQGTDLTVTDAQTGETYPLSGVSRYVAAMLQGKAGRDNKQELAAWKKAKDATLRECNAIYRRLGVLLTDDDICGESFYEPLLPGTIAELRTVLTNVDGQTGEIRAVCRDDKGAACVFLEKTDGTPAFKGAQGDPLPMLIQKSDGASLYATTDLAATLYRTHHTTTHPYSQRTASLSEVLSKPPFNGGLGADRIIYFVGFPQKLHFEMLFATVDALGWLHKEDREIRLEHVSFGSVLGEDRKMLRTRAGDSVKLKALLEEAVQRAEALVRASESDPEKRRGFTESEIQEIAETVGIGSVKYADLCQNRSTDYTFSWDKMLALQGNTAPYLLYAYARIRSIYRKGAEALSRTGHGRVTLDHPAERALAMRVLQLAEVVEMVSDLLLPNFLCDYLYDLAGKFMSFYESCPVLQAGDEGTKASRLALCDATARALKIGLGLLGIRTLERM
ncbi:MAG: arginine--tRNA ligase [Planctomycetota bacterium]